MTPGQRACAACAGHRHNSHLDAASTPALAGALPLQVRASTSRHVVYPLSRVHGYVGMLVDRGAGTVWVPVRSMGTAVGTKPASSPVCKLCYPVPNRAKLGVAGRFHRPLKPKVPGAIPGRPIFLAGKPTAAPTMAGLRCCWREEATRPRAGTRDCSQAPYSRGLACRS